ncbi:hypothetical protein F444_09452 [Phytophthora nicotianae P1976]|uniref:Elicitin-like protein n=1 Tax=Phytophthora nicotianae P1976 TaxID=1317066 RepID=A0A081A7M1_PHYNI|nr:hypothetical protein F444_09452 [Phytophthora nicotianae P1976]
MQPTYSITVVMLAATLVLVPNITAKACTFLQRVQIKSIAAAYFDSPDCVSSSFNSSGDISKTELCESACTKLIRELLPDTPDCERDDSNLAEIYGDLVTWCEESDSGSAFAVRKSKWAADAIPICTAEEVTIINDINTEGENGENCRGNVRTHIATSVAFCIDPTCVAYLANVEARLPNCSFEGLNVKKVVGDTVALCDDAGVTLPNTTTPAVTTTSPVPTATTQTPLATSSADSQATDIPATKSAATFVEFSSNFESVLTLTVVLAWVGL